jgi:pectin methylesterase-like acyl-CoA thioesterase
LLCVLVCAALGADSPAAANLNATVRNCQGPSPYSTIQAAVTAVEAAGGGTVSVCPGTYPEQVMIISQLTLKGIKSGTSDGAVIVPPNGGLTANAPDLNQGPTPNTVAAQVYVKDIATGEVNITNMTVDGTGRPARV